MHLESLCCDGVLFVKDLSQLEVKTGHLVVSEVTCQFNVDLATAIAGLPFGMMINLLCLDTNCLNKCSSLLKRSKIKRLLKPVVVSSVLPTRVTTATDNILDHILVHIYQFLSALLVKFVIFS